MGIVNINNENVCILNDDDLIYQIEKNCGYELADTLRNRLIMDGFETKLARERLALMKKVIVHNLKVLVVYCVTYWKKWKISKNT